MKKPLIILAVLVLVFPLSNLPCFATAGVIFYPSPHSRTVSSASLASDGTHLVTFYCYSDPERDPWRPDELYGRVKEWNGSSWEDLWENAGYGTTQCHYPDIAVRGDIIVASQTTDRVDLRIHSNNNNPDISWDGWLSDTYLSMANEKNPRVAFAFGSPYATYTSLGGTSINKVYIRCLSGCSYLPQLLGGYRTFESIFTPVSVGSVASAAGDDDAVYSAFTSAFVETSQGTGCVNVRKFTRQHNEYLGDCFFVGDGPRSPEIVLFSGEPIMAWTEEAEQMLYIAKWDGSDWFLIGSKEAGTNQQFGRVRVEASKSALYLSHDTTGGPQPQIEVLKWDGSNWSALPNPLDSGGGENISLADLAVHNDQPVVAFIEEGTLKVVKLTVPADAKFTASRTSGVAPLIVNFADRSTGDITSWSWNFGDGSTSTNQNPSHTYEAQGIYTVKLTVTDSAGLKDTYEMTINVRETMAMPWLPLLLGED